MPTDSDPARSDTVIVGRRLVGGGADCDTSYANSDKVKDFVFDADVMPVAKAAARAIPEVPLKGCDILRDERTGRVYVLELNPGGNTWHFSSAFLAQVRTEDPPEQNQSRLTQFDALSTAAHIWWPAPEPRQEMVRRFSFAPLHDALVNSERRTVRTAAGRSQPSSGVGQSRGWQDINDLYQIAAKVRWLDPSGRHLHRSVGDRRRAP